MAKEPISAERAEATLDRRAAVYWQQVAKQDPGQAGMARGNARDLRAEARAEDQAAERQENKPRRSVHVPRRNV